ncbi:MAG: response regulator [Acidobacteria bacterium]|nr:MAG: response regulator [Acidobacteriota bacterium]
MKDLILVVDDEPAVRELIKSQLEFLGFNARATSDAREALAIVNGDTPPSLAMLDIEMPGFSGVELLKQIKGSNEDIQVVMVSGLHDLGTVRKCLRAGAYDYLAKPFELDDLANTAERALERRRLVRQNREYQENLERMVDEQTEEIRETRDIALFTLAKLAESRDSDTGMHLERIAEYSRVLAETMRLKGHPEIDADFVGWITTASPLHDIGKVAIPDAILRKPGPLSPEETRIMRTHTTIGGDTLRSVLDKYSSEQTVLRMAMEIAYSHHERWDGEGYPRGLAGENIPLAARLVALADAYDAITSRRPYKAAEEHQEAERRIVVDRERHFDPQVVDAFVACGAELDAIRRRMQERQPSPHHRLSSLEGTPASLTRSGWQST